jgi:16S rRNA (cytosine967-C5)-methyltransferase
MRHDSNPAAHTGMSPIALRQHAVRILDLVLSKHEPLDHVLQKSDDIRAMSPSDRALLRMMVATTLRRMGQIDDLIMRAMDGRPLPKPDRLCHLLRLGVTQLFFMNIPDYAAVHLSVDVAVRMGFVRQKGLVNAVLRRLTREGAAWVSDQDIAVLNAPSWLLSSLERTYGLEKARGIIRASLCEAGTDITVKTPRDVNVYTDTLGAVPLWGSTLRMTDPSGSPEGWTDYNKGTWWIQDAAAALPITLLGHMMPDLSKWHVMDVCAAPGGKTAQLASIGARVSAVDLNANRMKRLSQNMHRLGFDSVVTEHVVDVFDLEPPAELFDLVVLDAPCSATGTMRRHPDLVHHRMPEDISRLADVQSRMLDHVIKYVKPNGYVLYMTCSLQPEEGENHIASFLACHPDATLVPFAPLDVVGFPDVLNTDGCLRILPTHLGDQGGMDGFFAALFRV